MKEISSPSSSYEEKVERLKQKFSALHSPDDRYRLIMELGKKLSAYPSDALLAENLVAGCQSRLYLDTQFKDGKLFFTAQADALISSGLAALLIEVYNGETPETLMKRPPTYLTDLGIFASLSPSRSNGLSQILLRMKRDAVKFLLLTHTK